MSTVTHVKSCAYHAKMLWARLSLHLPPILRESKSRHNFSDTRMKILKKGSKCVREREILLHSPALGQVASGRGPYLFI